MWQRKLFSCVPSVDSLEMFANLVSGYGEYKPEQEQTAFSSCGKHLTLVAYQLFEQVM